MENTHPTVLKFINWVATLAMLVGIYAMARVAFGTSLPLDTSKLEAVIIASIFVKVAYWLVDGRKEWDVGGFVSLALLAALVWFQGHLAGIWTVPFGEQWVTSTMTVVAILGATRLILMGVNIFRPRRRRYP